MRAFLILLLIIAISCQPSLLMTREERIKKKREVKSKLLDCIRENASEEFIKFMNENELNFRIAVAKNKDNISINDKQVIRNCKDKIFREANGLD